MKLNLLLVSFEDFPSDVELKFQECGFTCYYARGRLKVMETLKQKEINGVIWFHQGYSSALATDLINTFNQNELIPVIVLTTEVGESELTKRIQNRKNFVDLNDGLGEILATIEDTCLDKKAILSPQVKTSLPEINFREAMKTVASSGKKQPKYNKHTSSSHPIPWSSVDPEEKDFITESYSPPKNLLMRIGEKIKKLFS